VSYGKGIRPAETVRTPLDWRHRVNLSLVDPESQAGIEAGVDVFVGRRLTLRATRFDQRASGLIQDVIVSVEPRRGPGPPGSPMQNDPSTPTYALQNVGEVTNRGWEIESSTSVSHLRVAGMLSFVESRVARTARNYTGELLSGDRMLGVPAATGGVSAIWNSLGWQGSLSATRAWNWINYDRVATAEAAVSSPSALIGP